MLYKDDDGIWKDFEGNIYNDDTEFTSSSAPFNDLVGQVLQWQRLDKKSSYDGVIATADDWLDTMLFIQNMPNKKAGK
jgi:hypothetical protein